MKKKYKGEHPKVAGIIVIVVLGLLVFAGFVAVGTAKSEVYAIEEQHYGAFVEPPGLMSAAAGWLPFVEAKPEITIVDPGVYLASESDPERVTVFQVPEHLRARFGVRVVKGTAQRLADRWKTSDLPEDSKRRKLANWIGVKPLSVGGSVDFAVTPEVIRRIISPEGEVAEFEEEILLIMQEAVLENFDLHTDQEKFRAALELSISEVLKEKFAIEFPTLTLEKPEVLEGEAAEERNIEFASALSPAQVGTTTKVFWTVFLKTFPVIFGVIAVVIGIGLVCPDLLFFLADIVAIFGSA